MAAQSTPLQLTNFYHFPDLPAEIRLRIYTLSLPPPRLMPLNYNSPVSPLPSPTQPTFQQTQLQRHRSPNNTPIIRGITSTAPIPPLLRVDREARRLALDHYALFFPLSGSNLPGNIYFDPCQDTIYFPSIPGYLTSFKNFTHIHTLADPAHLLRVQRLAVHEDLFLEEEKTRWRDLSFGREGLGDFETGIRRRRSGDVGAGVDGVTMRCLEDFWDAVRRKFGGVEEVWILGDGMERRVLDGDDEVLEEESRGSGDKHDGTSLPKNRRDSFRAKVERTVNTLEAETGWVAPRWRILPGDDVSKDDLIQEVETVEDGGVDDSYLGGNKPVGKMQFALQAETTSDKAAFLPELRTRQILNE